MKYCLIAADFGNNPDVRPLAVHNFIANCRSFSRWWSNIPLIWIVETSLNCTEVAQLMDPTFGPANFLVTEIHANQTDGRLPKFAWEWFYPQQAQPFGLLGAPPKEGGLF